jgi:hypothetical protein
MTLDNDTLASIGISLNPEKTETLIQHFEKTLQERVGIEIFETLDDDHAGELLALQQNGDSRAVAEYIKQHVSDLEAIVEDQTDIMLGELADGADLLGA